MPLSNHEFEMMWGLACDILNLAGYSNGSISDTRHGGSGSQKTTQVDWAADMRGVASPEEMLIITRYTLTGDKVKGFDSIIYRCAKRVPEDTEKYGYVLLEKLY